MESKNLDEFKDKDMHFSQSSLKNSAGSKSEGNGYYADLEDINDKIAEDPLNTLRNTYLQKVYNLINTYIPYLNCMLRDTNSAIASTSNNDSCDLTNYGSKLNNGLKKSNVSLTHNTPASVQNVLENIQQTYQEAQTEIRAFVNTVLSEMNRSEIINQYNTSKTEYNNALKDYNACNANAACTELLEKEEIKKRISFKK